MEPRSQRDNSGKRYVHRDYRGRYTRKPERFAMPSWVENLGWIAVVGLVYLIFS
jgi:hypothetical protein